MEGIWIHYFIQSVSHIVSMKSIFVFASALILYFYTAFNLLFPTKGPWLLLFYYLLHCCLWARIKISVDHLISSLSNFSSSLNTVLQTYKAVFSLLTTRVNIITFLLKERENNSQAAEAIVCLHCPFQAVIYFSKTETSQLEHFRWHPALKQNISRRQHPGF